MRPYAVFINEQALASTPRSAAQREPLMKFVRSLADNPNATGDFTERDNTGRTIQVKVVGRYAVTYWADHAVSEVKVTHIKSADK
jgi:mRNA-degrading endonuclease RelE of RelBE toxin-antitoxin system